MTALTPRERLKIGSASHIRRADPSILIRQHAQPKPWGDKESGPYPGNDDEDGGHYDGDIGEPFGTPPGEEIRVPPKSSPTSDNLELRASLEAAADASPDQDVQYALRAIEARLAEITQFMPTATRGASQNLAIKLGVLAHII